MAHETQIYSRGVTKGKTGEIEVWTQFFRYSKALRNMADLADTRFWIGSQKIWDARIYVVRTLSLKDPGFWEVYFSEKLSLSYQIFFQVKI